MSHTTQAEHKEEAGITIPTPIPMPSAAQAPTENKEGKRGFREWLNILAYPVAAISGGWVWKNHVDQEFWGTHGRKGAFKPLEQDSEIKYNGVMENLKSDKTLSSEQRREMINSCRPEFSKARKDFSRDVMGFKNTFHYYGSIARHAKDNALISGFTIFGVSLGAMLMVANSKHFLGGKDEENKKGGMSK